MIVSAIIGGITLFVFQEVWQWLTSPTTDLRAEVSYSRFVLPPNYESQKNLKDPNGILFVTVKNNGKQPATSISITLPDTIVAKIYKEGVESQTFENKEKLDIGELRNGETASIVAWTWLSPYEHILKNSMKLSHSAGVGSVNVLTPVGPFWRWLEEQWSSILIIVFSLGWVTISILELNREARRKSNSA